MEKIPEKLVRNTEILLYSLGAIDDNGEVTKEGESFNMLGIDFRLARFLLACNHLGCLASG